MKTYFKKGYYLPVQKYRGKASDIRFPCVASLKIDGELQYIIKKGSQVKSVNKSKYGRFRENYPALKEFQRLALPNGIYLAELYWNEGRTKEDFYGFLRHKESDNLRLAIWGILHIGNKTDFDTLETVKFLNKVRPLTKGFEFLTITPIWWCENRKRLEKLANQILDEGWEGLVVRNLNAIYQDGQSRDWIKIKKKERELNVKNKNGKYNNLQLTSYGIWL